MKKELKILAIVLATIVFFLAGFGVGSKKGRTFNLNNETVVETVQQSDNGSQP